CELEEHRVQRGDRAPVAGALVEIDELRGGVLVAWADRAKTIVEGDRRAVGAHTLGDVRCLPQTLDRVTFVSALMGEGRQSVETLELLPRIGGLQYAPLEHTLEEDSIAERRGDVLDEIELRLAELGILQQRAGVERAAFALTVRCRDMSEL